MHHKKKTHRERVEELLNTLDKGVREFEYSPEQFAAVLEMKALMPSYSFRNLMLAKAQLPGASFLAGFKHWKELGRSVQKGERALRILAPKIVKKENKKGEEEDTLVGFVAIPVFDVSQTEGDPLPIDKLQIELEGDCPEAQQIIEVATKMAENDDCPIFYGDTGNAKGYYQPHLHRITVSSALSVNHCAKTLVHELVHSRVDCMDYLVKSSEEKEVVAEGTAFIICRYFGLDTSDYSFQYVKGWAKQSESPLLDYGEKIAKTAGQLIQEFETIQKEISSLQTA
ncbi:ArdC-like ssDNA-binding domain-containing protein [Gracilibacillus sp. YIM 98692]|uniref:ArdC-like ssDNA-binding domain-containing protein n=1 Tax=Gracilibacillus sp. YIM 98692 TaxID=2663532 RepID=UPI0013D537B2|nr:ArdC-like ssDNA-binding domain-containing protein [Gracilibacillus sp. YIM 98692]